MTLKFPLGSATLKGMIAVKTLIYKAKKLPYPHSKRFVIKYEKPGGKKRLQEDFSKVKYDETRDFYMKNGVSSCPYHDNTHV